MKIVLQFVLLVCFGAGTIVNAKAAEPGSGQLQERVTYAGLAFAGDASTISARLPHSYALADQLSNALLLSAKAATPAHYQLVLNNTDLSLEQGDTLAVALVIEDEDVSTELLSVMGERLFKVLVRITAQLVVFDFEPGRQSVVATYPIVTPAYIDTFDSQPSQAQIRKLIADYYLANDSVALIQEASNTLEAAAIKRKYRNRIGIGRVLLAEEVSTTLDDAGLLLGRYESAIGRMIGAHLSAAQGVAVLPQQLDKATAQMAMRMVGTQKRFVLQFPSPDYVLNTGLMKLIQTEYGRDHAKQVFLYGALAQFQLKYANRGEAEPIFDNLVQHGVIKEVPTSQVIVDHAAAMEVAIEELFESFTSQVAQPDKTWLKDQKFNKQEKNQFKDFARVLEQCR